MTPKIEIASEEYHKILDLSKEELESLIDDIHVSIKYIEKAREFQRTSNHIGPNKNSPKINSKRQGNKNIRRD